MLRIYGAQGTIKDIDMLLQKLLDFSKKHSVSVQVLNADLVYGTPHLISAAEHAIRSMKEQSNTTNSLAMELLLYASGERQIKLAIDKMGVKPGKGKFAFVFIDDTADILEAKGLLSDCVIDDLLMTLNVKCDDKVLEGNMKTLKSFGISDEELQTITKAKYGHLILEKVAMVDVIK